MTSSDGSPSTKAAIAVRGLRKSYAETIVLTGVDLTVLRGTVVALLGPNGAGKTTMVQILSTLIPADAGELTVAGHDVGREPAAVRRAIGVTGQFSAVDNLLTGAENLALMADLNHLARVRFADRTRLASAAGVLPDAVADDEALTLEVPSDGDSIRDVRALLDRLDRAGIDAEGLSVHTADLDDVFLALTGTPTTLMENR